MLTGGKEILIRTDVIVEECRMNFKFSLFFFHQSQTSFTFFCGEFLPFHHCSIVLFIKLFLFFFASCVPPFGLFGFYLEFLEIDLVNSERAI